MSSRPSRAAGPRVVILMGSESDRPVMEPAAKLLESFGVGHRVAVASAHRSPSLVRSLAAEAEAKGAKVFIAGAGGAAHLAGAVAGLTTLPVIGVPIRTALGGLDSLLSTVQMPKGVPVATVAIDGAANAALLAVEVLALSDPELAAELKRRRSDAARDLEAGAGIATRGRRPKATS